MDAFSGAIIDLIAIAILMLNYTWRHRRPDLVLAYLTINVGVVAITIGLLSTEAAVGLGLGLFGVLSIIRLRSASLTHEEVAYYFAALALGLLTGLHPGGLVLTSALSITLVAVVLLVDQPWVLGRARHQVVTLDRTYPDHPSLVADLEQRLGERVHRARVLQTDYAQELTVVDVRSTVTGTGTDRAVGHPDAAALTPIGPLTEVRR